MGLETEPLYLERPERDTLAYFYSPATGEGAGQPCVVFLGGFRSDMGGSKALFLEAHCRARGQGFVRFDYSGHGSSQGRFEDGCIGQWRDDARAVLNHVAQGPVILVGSSMGGWISLLLLFECTERIAGFVGIAAAPDFTQLIEAALSAEQKKAIQERGVVEIPSEYGTPYVITRRLLEDGRVQSVLGRGAFPLKPVTLVQGRMDPDVPWQTAEAIKARLSGSETRIIYIEDGEHRLSRPQDLALIVDEVDRMITRIAG